MIKNIIKDVHILEQPSQDATREDIQIGYDLRDTLLKHAHECVGMAANMIGEHKNIIVVFDNKQHPLLMFNPVIIKSYGKVYQTKESCLSLQGSRETKRYEKIKVQYYNENFQMRIKTFQDFTAQIIQHEIDHCHGILI